MAVFAVFTLLTTAGVLAQTAAPQVITTDAAPAQAAPQTAPAAAPAQAPAAQTPAPANTAVRTAKPAAAVRQGYAYGYPYGYAPQQSYYNARGNRPVSFQEYFGFDGIPFNGSHIQAFRRYHGRGF